MKTLIDKTHESDKGSLCDSRHTIEVGVTQDANGVIVPLQNYIIVGFNALDTSGGGKVERWFNKAVELTINTPKMLFNLGGKIGEKLADGTIIAGEGLATATTSAGERLADISRDAGVVYGEGAVGGFAKGYKETVDKAGSAIKKLKFWAEHDYSPLNYAPFESESQTLFGTDFHPVNASAHKMRFEAWCIYEGKERKMFDSEISGCTPLLTKDECLACCDSTTFEQFLISSPGEWRVKVSSVATGTCASLDYEDEATFTVPTPEGWEPQPIYATLTSLSTDISQAVGFEVPPAYLAIGGSILIGGIAFKILRKN